MMYASYRLTGDAKIPATVSLGAASTPVWMQQLWENGEFARYIRANGCGHCCTAMAANLYGISIDPYQEYLHCRSLWGAPNEEPQERGEHHFLSVAGIKSSSIHAALPFKNPQPIKIGNKGQKKMHEVFRASFKFYLIVYQAEKLFFNSPLLREPIIL